MARQHLQGRHPSVSRPETLLSCWREIPTPRGGRYLSLLAENTRKTPVCYALPWKCKRVESQKPHFHKSWKINLIRYHNEIWLEFCSFIAVHRWKDTAGCDLPRSKIYEDTFVILECCTNALPLQKVMLDGQAETFRHFWQQRLNTSGPE